MMTLVAEYLPRIIHLTLPRLYTVGPEAIFFMRRSEWSVELLKKDPRAFTRVSGCVLDILDLFFGRFFSWFKDMDVSKNRGTPKWIGKPYYNGWFGGTIIFGNTRMKTRWSLVSICWSQFVGSPFGRRCVIHLHLPEVRTGITCGC